VNWTCYLGYKSLFFTQMLVFKSKWCIWWLVLIPIQKDGNACLPIYALRLQILCYLCFPAITILQQLLFIIQQFLIEHNTPTSSHNVSFNCTLRFGKMGNKWQILVASQHACSISVADKEQIKKHRWEVQRLHLMGFCGELKIGTLHNSINRANFLAETTIDALCHVSVIPVITSYDLVI
jgi:hypothetical protein